MDLPGLPWNDAIQGYCDEGGNKAVGVTWDSEKNLFVATKQQKPAMKSRLKKMMSFKSNSSPRKYKNKKFDGTSSC